jgi:hypothetical protein
VLGDPGGMTFVDQPSTKGCALIEQLPMQTPRN